jgi:BlaI family transcriptional regulator, penicillinase repressor
VARPPSPRPTDGELAILRVLWQRRGQSVTEIRKALSDSGVRVSAQAIGTRLQIMLDKGLVRRDDRQKTHFFYANVTEATTKRSMLRDLITRLFGGSAKELVVHALDAEKATPQDVKEIRTKLDELNGGR